MPTVLRYKDYRFFFFSREETRVHIHVYSPNGEAKFWLKPEVELAKNVHFSRKQLHEIEKVIDSNYEMFVKAWEEYFESRSN